MYQKGQMALKKYVKQFFKVIYLHNVHPHFLVASWVSCQIYKKGGRKGSQFLEGGCQKSGGDFFQQGGGVEIFV